jgi:phospholipid/cholesterol/gamma-HCH transport system substrate-binding protein
MQRNAIEPILGALVIVAAVAFLFFAYNKAGQRSLDGYALDAQFSSIDGLETGSDVRISGVKVGQVTDISLDPETYLAIVRLVVAPEVKVPVDTVASVSTEGLLGGKYLGLLPGASDTMLAAGGRIARTEASVSLESLIGKFIYGGADSQGGGSKGGSPGAAQSPPQASHP